MFTLRSTEITKPVASSPAARKRMQRQRERDTTCEMALRSRLHSFGLRYRVDAKPLKHSRRRADLVFSRVKVAVFVDGCFWHGCPEHGTLPKANADWWETKLAANRERDEDTNRQLVAGGWVVLRVWEHEDPGLAAEQIARVVRSRASRAG